MSHKQRPRLGNAIATTILSLFSGVSLVGVDKAQAALLTYTLDLDSTPGRSYLKVDNSTLTGIGVEEIAVSEGRFYGYTFGGSKEYQDFAGVTASFYEGNFTGLNTSGGDQVITEVSYEDPGEPPVWFILDSRISWYIETFPVPYLDAPPGSAFFGYYEQYTTGRDGRTELTDREFYNSWFSYTLVDTEAEPVPEPLTAGGTALALAGLSWLKHKKKMAG
ncbi:PEP-CTERM sorting domain-containing protein [Microcoleus sp. B3-A4]|uniref:PEP-CTERM sorting domain-containing protein n=1 Tax=Microcoleus sp. B3-A4 TaxID=2818653 RepID=UPI002FD4E6F9